MQRIFTKKIGRYDIGSIRDYSLLTWKQIEKTLGLPMDKFSRPLDDVAMDGIAQMKDRKTVKV